jgi:periplasmic protein TonB
MFRGLSAPAVMPQIFDSTEWLSLMAYVDQDQSKEKTIAAVITAILLAAVGYAFYTGLAFNIIKKAAEKMTVLDIKEPPPPPPKQPPPPPKEQPKVESPPIVTPPPIVQPPVVNAPPIVTTPTPPPAPVIQAPVAPAPPPAPPKPSAASHASPKGSFQSLMSTDDYPPSALRNNEAGTVSFKLDVGPDGKVSNCTVTGSSGFADLDQTACRLLQRRARFTPAKDSAGNAIADVYSSRFTWQIPKD